MSIPAPVQIVLAMDGLLLAITVLLAIADKLLVSYGECTITVKEEEGTKEFKVQGGGTLLTVLNDNGMNIPASCAGRGSCGYCKVGVSSGGGQLLPTEEIFMNKEEERDGIRLACQVKVKNDIELYVPDLLTTVRSMAKSQTFDTSLDWRFVRDDKPALAAAERPVTKLDRKMKRQVLDIVDKHRDTPGAIMPVLHDINATFLYLPEPVLRLVSQELDIPVGSVFRIATFYNAFSLEPRGKYIITVCTGTACHVKGAAEVLEVFEQQLGIKAGGTTEDMHFTLDAVRCIGCCGLAPVLTVNEDVHGLMTRKKVPELIEQYKGA